MKYKYKKEKSLLIYMLLASAVIVLLYGLGASPLYIHEKSRVMQELYGELKHMELKDLNDDDQETLDDYHKEKMEILIVDENSRIQYSSKSTLSDKFVEKHITSREDQFSSKAEIDRRGYRLRQVLVLKGKITQKDHVFYIYIRKEIQSALEMIRLTVIYLILVLALASVGVSCLIKRKTIKSHEENKQADFKLLERQREFVANISHELKTPLAVVSSQVEMLELMGEKIDREYYFSSIHEELDKMSKMIGELLDFTMLDDQLDKMQTGIVDISEMLEYLMMKYDAVFQKNSIKIEKEIQPGCNVLGNQMYLERAVNNYLMNAFQHTVQGQKIKISVRKDKKNVRIEVYNEGDLIEQDQLERIWDSFYTFSRKKQKNEQETNLKNIGLGLFVVNKIVQKHKGSCGAENLSEGVLFWMELPLYEKGESKNEK